MKKQYLLGHVMLMLFILCIPVHAQNDLVANPGFEEVLSNGYPANWTVSMWYETGASFARLTGDAYEGSYSAMVENVNPNDARFEQAVAVEPSSYYRIACMVKAENCGLEANGAGISIKDTFVSSEYLYDTGGQWMPLELYGRTGDDQRELTVMLRVGGYDSENTGKAWFDAFEMEKLDDAPVGVGICDFTIPDSSSSSAAAENPQRDYLPMILALAVIFVLVTGMLSFYIKSGKLRIQMDGVERDPTAERLFRPKDYRMRLKRIDCLLMVGLTVIYAVFAFLNLGSTSAPQTDWTSTEPGEQITFDLGDEQVFHLAYYGGICDTSFTVELSKDGERWSDPKPAQYDQGQIFRWLWYVPDASDENYEWTEQESGLPMQTARYVRLTAEWSGLILSEVAFLDTNGEVLPVVSVHSAGGNEPIMSDPKYLIDEQDTVPPYPSYYNSTYFDEIYHARTAYEHLHGLHAYEYTHPPLGKVLIMLGIRIFGMTPFGWRFMGTLFGVLMIPVMYLLGKQLVHRPSLAFIGAFLMAVDCMHFTQTRIATIDTYGVFFIMLMYLFMLRYSQMSFHTAPLGRTLIPLGLSGISMGLAIASKWIGVYAGLGLAVLLLMSFVHRYKEYRFVQKHMEELDGGQRMAAQRVLKLFPKNLSITVGFCILMFIFVPVLIYFLSYYPHLAPDGNWSVKGIIDMQKSMLSYHSTLRDRHSFESPWYEWPLIIKPMWYYDGNSHLPEGYVSSISCMGNPAVWWGGLIALIFVVLRSILIDNKDRGYQFVVIGFLTQYLPWVLVSRLTFIYHYFASVPFIILCTVLLFDSIRIRRPSAFKTGAIVFCAVAFALFVAFYPLISGTPVPRGYAMNLKWFNWINFKYW